MSLVSGISQSTANETATAAATSKRVFDLVLACCLLVPATLVMLAAMLLVRLTSPGPVIYSQTRLGRNGRHFTIYKIRTMFYNCERHSGVQWSKPGDSRVTWIGRILRATHIDELPQLFNILRGEMSLVGPRPERPEIVSALEPAILCYGDRVQVQPGVTGLLRCNFRPMLTWKAFAASSRMTFTTSSTPAFGLTSGSSSRRHSPS